MLFTTGFRSNIGAVIQSPGIIFNDPTQYGAAALKGLYEPTLVYKCYNESSITYNSFYYKFQRRQNRVVKIPICEIASNNRYRDGWYTYRHRIFAGTRWFVSLSGQLFGELICQYDKYGKDLAEYPKPPWLKVTTLKMLSLHTLCQLQEDTWYHFNITVTTECSDKIILPGINPYHIVTASTSIKVNGESILLYPMNSYNVGLTTNITSVDGNQHYVMWGYPYYITLQGGVSVDAYFKDMALSDVPLEEGYSLG